MDESESQQGKVDKRRRGTPTGKTPQQPQKRQVRRTGEERGSTRGEGVRSSARRKLLSSQEVWTCLEDGALVEFILLTRPLDRLWPADKSFAFWDGTAEHVHSRSGSSVQRTGVYSMYIHTQYMYVSCLYHFRECLLNQSGKGTG